MLCESEEWRVRPPSAAIIVQTPALRQHRLRGKPVAELPLHPNASLVAHGGSSMTRVGAAGALKSGRPSPSRGAQGGREDDFSVGDG